jgi:hypothetical protein
MGLRSHGSAFREGCQSLARVRACARMPSRVKERREKGVGLSPPEAKTPGGLSDHPLQLLIVLLATNFRIALDMLEDFLPVTLVNSQEVKNSVRGRALPRDRRELRVATGVFGILPRAGLVLQSV